MDIAGSNSMEKLFIVCTFDCSFEYYEETIEKFVKEYGDGVVIDYDLNKINDHKSHSFYNVTSLEAFEKMLLSEEAEEMAFYTETLREICNGDM